MVGRSFRNANQPTVIGRSISLCSPWSRDFDSVSGCAPLDESAPGWEQRGAVL